MQINEMFGGHVRENAGFATPKNVVRLSIREEKRDDRMRIIDITVHRDTAINAGLRDQDYVVLDFSDDLTTAKLKGYRTRVPGSYKLAPNPSGKGKSKSSFRVSLRYRHTFLPLLKKASNEILAGENGELYFVTPSVLRNVLQQERTKRSA